MTVNNLQTLTTSRPSGTEYIVERLFDAPRELVFAAYSSADHLRHWWGPAGWTLPVCEIDFRPGGVWLYCMRSPEGQESWGKAVYREIEAPQRIVYVDQFVDNEGRQLEGTPELLITVTFEENSAGQTVVTMHDRFDKAEDLDAVLEMGMETGIAQTLDRLEAHLAELQESGS